ncbi:phosphoribosylanthranilate isomerase [Qingshengfaniella alkalisoli]|uniref:N-(5'-phosphoribosyl)anthranilate isomerase n=1 Tax=Qingshengfaniella alkalisoli TaxID=2599296 RepID=A0A5B8I5M6_9RHOB|nr:phosphoribosylanthranilate isomerase [Qingshengfaniella alkalisoli]QDY68669.1 phosphoribosylanthranilate isomerase [Qingshengfaniella alkalisoli]
MTQKTRVKICGLSRSDDIAAAAAKAGAAYVGFAYFPKSPRHVSLDRAAQLAADVPVGIAKVMFAVDPDDDLIDDIAQTVPLDMLQLHGSETPERVAEIRSRIGLPVMKVIGVASAEDLVPLSAYETVADQLLIDAKAPKNAELPGGNGVTFDWDLLAGRAWSRPWMLAGGLNSENVAEAIRRTGARQVDVSSGVENAPGVKDAALIKAFVAAAQG